MRQRTERILGTAMLVTLFVNAGVSSGFFAPIPGIVPLPSEPIPLGNGTFTDVSVEAGLTFRHTGWAPPRAPYPAIIQGGVAIGDFDRDGWEDLYFTDGPAPPGAPGAMGNRLYRNSGNGTFADVTDAAGVGRGGWGAGAAWGDYDADGWLDLFVAIQGRNVLFRNLHDGGFIDTAESAGVTGVGRCPDVPCLPSSAGWFDYDLDGQLDLYVTNNLKHDPDVAGPLTGEEIDSSLMFGVGQPNQLYRNNGDGTFTDRASEAGVANPEGKSLGVLLADLTEDGRPDIYVANDISDDVLFVNEGDGRFLEVAQEVGIVEFKSNMGVSVGDFTNDGRHHLVSTNLRGGSISCCGTSAYIDNGDGSYSYRTPQLGLFPTTRGTGWGIDFTDYDLDGDLDLFMAVGTFSASESERDTENQFYRNDGGRFTEITDQLGDYSDRWISRGAAAFDYDHDGDEDLVFANSQGGPAILLRNDLGSGQRNRFVQLELEGKSGHWEALGASVRMVRPDGVILEREIITARSYQTCASHVLTFGLGPEDHADFVIHWPKGETQIIRLEAGHRYLIQEGAAKARTIF